MRRRPRFRALVLAAAAVGCGLRAEPVLFSAEVAPDGGAFDSGSEAGPDSEADARAPDAPDAPDGSILCGVDTCPPGYACTDDPTDTCDADSGPCPGRCLPAATGKTCGGIAGLVCAADEWCDYGDHCPIPDEAGECRKRPKATDCGPAAATCAHPVCTCDGVNQGCDWCGLHQNGRFVKRCN